VATVRYVTAVPVRDGLVAEEVQSGGSIKDNFISSANTDSEVHAFRDVGQNARTFILSDKSHYSLLRPFHVTAGSAAIAAPVCCLLVSTRHAARCM
jgi:hypothetical protein